MRTQLLTWRLATGLCAFALVVLPARADDHGDSCGASTAIATDGTVVGAIIDPASDEDWLSFSAVAGNRYDATAFTVSASFNDVVEVIGPDCATVLAGWGYYS